MAASTDALSVTSSGNASARSPSGSRRRATACASVKSWSAIATLQPSARKVSAIAMPMPRAAAGDECDPLRRLATVSSLRVGRLAGKGLAGLEQLDPDAVGIDHVDRLTAAVRPGVGALIGETNFTPASSRRS